MSQDTTGKELDLEVKAPVAEQKPEVDVHEVDVPSVPKFIFILETVQKHLHDLHALVLEYRKRIDLVNKKEEELRGREAHVADLHKSLVPREAAAKRVEDIQKLHKEAQALMDKASLRLEAAVEAEKKLKQSTSIAQEEIANNRTLSQREANAVEQAKKRIDEEVSKRVEKVLTDMGIKKLAEVPAAAVTAEVPADKE